MANLKRPSVTEISARKFEEELYDLVRKEVESGLMRPGLWAKAIASAEGDDATARALYIKFRAQSMLDETYVAARAKELAGALESRLLDAAMFGRTEELESLLNQGVNINARNSYGATALYLASLNGNIAVVEILLERGADRSIRNLSGLTPLQAAEGAAQREIAELLTEYCIAP